MCDFIRFKAKHHDIMLKKEKKVTTLLDSSCCWTGSVSNTADFSLLCCLRSLVWDTRLLYGKYATIRELFWPIAFQCIGALLVLGEESWVIQGVTGSPHSWGALSRACWSFAQNKRSITHICTLQDTNLNRHQINHTMKNSFKKHGVIVAAECLK